MAATAATAPSAAAAPALARAARAATGATPADKEKGRGGSDEVGASRAKRPVMDMLKAWLQEDLMGVVS
jgi:hypothetical protein